MNAIHSSLMGTAINGRYIEHGEFVPTAGHMTKRITSDMLQNPHTLRRLYGAQCELTGRIGHLLPLETKLRSALVAQLSRVENLIGRYEHTPKFDLPTIDPSFLSWKTRSGYPGFALFRLESDMMNIRYVRKNDFSFLDNLTMGMLEESPNTPPHVFFSDISLHPIFPDILVKPYLDQNLAGSLQAICDYEDLREIRLTAYYDGVMPDSTREKIHYWQSRKPGEPKFDDILIVAEAPDASWKVDKIPKADPIVLGVAHGFLWPIDFYDLTPVESFVKNLHVRTSSKAQN